MNRAPYADRYLDVDLTTRTTRFIKLPDEWKALLVGGKGIAAKLLYDLVPEGADPLGPDNVIVYATGPLTGTIGPSMRGMIAGKSPLTGGFCDCYVGGHFMPELRYAGYDGIVIRGASKDPVYLLLDDDRVELRDATALWGLDTDQVYGALKDAVGEGFRISCIGPAGEKRVRFALIDCEPHRQAARGGLGAVLGAKGLKAIACRGTGTVRPADPEGFREASLRGFRSIKGAPVLSGLGNLGTMEGVEFANLMGLFPTRNFSRGTLEGYEKVTPEACLDRIWLRHGACPGCPIHCTKFGVNRRGRYKGTFGDNSEYETAGMISGNLAIDSPEALHYLNALCDRLGLDTMSSGGVAGFAIEAFERGLVTRADTGGVTLRFGDADCVAELLRLITERRLIGDVLAEGTARAAKAMGPKAAELAMHIGGLEIPAWGPRGSNAMALAYVTADRVGCHMRAWPITFELDGKDPIGRPIERLSFEGKGYTVAWEQDYQTAFYTMVICQFGLTGIPVDVYLDLMTAATGTKWTQSRLMELGERIWNLTRLFNIKHGQEIPRQLPSRFSEPLADGVFAGHAFQPGDIDRLLEDYYRIRGWGAGGTPEAKTLTRLGLDELLTVEAGGLV